MIALPEKKTRGYYGGISITDSTVTVNAGYCGLCAEYADIEISGDNAVVKVKGGDHAIGGPSEEDFFKVADKLTCLGSADLVDFAQAKSPTEIKYESYGETLKDYFVFVTGGGKAKTVVVQAEQPAPPPSSGGSGNPTVTAPAGIVKV